MSLSTHFSTFSADADADASMSSHVALNRVLCWFLDVSRNLVFFPWRCKSCFQRSSARKCQKTWQLLLRFSKLDSFCLLEIGSASNLRKKAQKQKRERKKLWSHFVCKRNFLTLLIIFLNGAIFIYHRWVHFHSLNNPCLAIMGLALDLIVLKSQLRFQTCKETETSYITQATWVATSSHPFIWHLGVWLVPRSRWESFLMWKKKLEAHNANKH